MVDGLDGSGKSTVTRSWHGMLEARGNTLFDTIAFEKSNGRIATLADIGSATVIISGEPGYAGVGKKIRDLMLRPNSGFSPREVTEAFADQRLERYEALIVPAIERGFTIIQDRGITSSLAFQPTMSEEITEEFVASLPGNALALEHRPDYVVICEVPAAVAAARLGGRTEKQDEALFEKQEYLERIAMRYRADSWKKYLLDRGTKFITFDADQPIALAINAAQHLLLDLL